MSRDHYKPDRPPALSVASVRPRRGDESLREWWHEILGNYGRYRCYAVVLALPGDIEATRYLTVFGRELEFISGQNCLVIALTKIGFRRYGFDDKILSIAMDEHISEGHSIQVANIFNVPFDEFPCMILFNDIRSPNHVKITLEGMTAEDIVQVMRSIFTYIQQAVSQNKDPLEFIETQRNSQVFVNKGKTIVSELRCFAGKTFETAMEAWIKTVVQQFSMRTFI